MDKSVGPGHDEPGAGTAQILDIRSRAAFCRGHLPGAVGQPVVAVPTGTRADDHFRRVLPSIFLPPREADLIIAGDDQALLDRLALHLAGRGRARVSVCNLSNEPSGGLSESGPSRAHLWRPPDWLAAHEELLPPPTLGPVLDLGCGSGRAAVWLAERGYRVTGIDWQGEALELGRLLARSRGVQVDFRAADLRQKDVLPPGKWAVVLNFRYLQRDLAARLDALTMPAGVVLLRTFREAPGYEGHPRRQYRLLPGELLRLFPAGPWQLLAHEVGHDPDSRPAAGVVARRAYG